MSKIPEILAPIGDFLMCRAAVHAGADAVYVGMPNFNARGRAPTLSLKELAEIIDFCHLYSVKVYIACNVLVFEPELRDFVESLREVIELKPDAFIVQDIGVCRLIKSISADIEIHASTQMTVTSLEAIQATDDLELTRYVLGREVSIIELEKIKPQTDKEIELFVHGALCVSYSGQCLTSESFGGRSANRGQCAQACRLDYKLIVDDEVKFTGDQKYFVSPKDNCSLADVPKLKALGIDSFKIEGRLKSPQYVASVVKAYKEMASGLISEQQIEARINELAQVYSRGFFNGWMGGVNHQELVDGRFSSNQGLEVGTVTKVSGEHVEIKSQADLKNGDGLLFRDYYQDQKVGGKIYSTKKIGNHSISIYLGPEFKYDLVRTGMAVHQNSSPTVLAKFEKLYTEKENFRKINIKVFVICDYDNLSVVVTDQDGNKYSAKSDFMPAMAKSLPVTQDFIENEFNALSGTPFKIERFDIKLGENLFVPHKALKTLRQEAYQGLLNLRQAKTPVTLKPLAECLEFLESKKLKSSDSEQGQVLNVLIRESAQIEALRDQKIGIVYLDFEFGKEYAPSLAAVRDLGLKCGIATTRIFKTGELGHLKQIERLKPDAVLVRNLGALEYFRNSELSLYGDFSLNIANSLTADWFLSKKLKTICPSYDLNSKQLFALLEKVDGRQTEITIHQYMPSFHMEHCVFAAFLSSGTSFRDCGRPCEKHRVSLMDNNGKIHPLKPDAECRNTMFNGVPQSAAKLFNELQALGVRNFRLEALFETPSELSKKIKVYSQLINGECTAEDLYRTLKIVEKYGVSEGQLLSIRNYQDRKKEYQV
jgi:putative protease